MLACDIRLENVLSENVILAKLEEGVDVRNSAESLNDDLIDIKCSRFVDRFAVKVNTLDLGEEDGKSLVNDCTNEFLYVRNLALCVVKDIVRDSSVIERFENVLSAFCNKGLYLVRSNGGDYCFEFSVCIKLEKVGISARRVNDGCHVNVGSEFRNTNDVDDLLFIKEGEKISVSAAEGNDLFVNENELVVNESGVSAERVYDAVLAVVFKYFGNAEGSDEICSVTVNEASAVVHSDSFNYLVGSYNVKYSAVSFGICGELVFDSSFKTESEGLEICGLDVLPVIRNSGLSAHLCGEHLLCGVTCEYRCLDRVGIGGCYCDEICVVHSQSKIKSNYLGNDVVISEDVVNELLVCHKSGESIVGYESCDIIIGEYLSEIVLSDNLLLDESVDNRLCEEIALDLGDIDECLINLFVLDEKVEGCVVSVTCEIVLKSVNCVGIGDDTVSNSLTCSKLRDLRAVLRRHNSLDYLVVYKVDKLSLYSFISHKIVNERRVVYNVLNELVCEDLVLQILVESELDNFICEKCIKLVYVDSRKHFLDGNEINDFTDGEHIQQHIEGEILPYYADGKIVDQTLEIVYGYVISRELSQVVKSYFLSFS